MKITPKMRALIEVLSETGNYWFSMDQVERDLREKHRKDTRYEKGSWEIPYYQFGAPLRHRLRVLEREGYLENRIHEAQILVGRYTRMIPGDDHYKRPDETWSEYHERVYTTVKESTQTRNINQWRVTPKGRERFAEVLA